MWFDDNTDKLTVLIGKKIEKIFIDKNRQEFLVFEFEDSHIIYLAVGDCCSESWFADIISVDALLGGTVTAAIEIPMPQDNFRTRQDIDIVYGILITTDKGRCTIAFRNSSNGYYGGWLIPMETSTCEGQLKWEEEKLKEVEWQEITQDYSA
jgi:hypothetical protein